MSGFHVGQLVRIIQSPEQGPNRNGEVMRVITSGPHNTPGTVMLMSSTGQSLMVWEEQIEPVEDASTSR